VRRPEIETRLASTRPVLLPAEVARNLGPTAARHDLEYGSVGVTEHHFHIGDFEVSDTKRALPIRGASCRGTRPQAALRQPVKSPNLFVSFCYQLPVNHSPAG
jgi:hypothetical protein